MKKIVLTALAFATFALADAPAAYATCKACHGVKGEVNTTTQSKSHVPANLTKAEIEVSLNGYKDGSYAGAGKMAGIMKGQVARLSADDIKALAEYMGK